MATYQIILTNIPDTADPGKTIVTYLEANLAAILAQNPQAQVSIQRLT